MIEVRGRTDESIYQTLAVMLKWRMRKYEVW